IVLLPFAPKERVSARADLLTSSGRTWRSLAVMFTGIDWRAPGTIRGVTPRSTLPPGGRRPDTIVPGLRYRTSGGGRIRDGGPEHAERNPSRPPVFDVDSAVRRQGVLRCVVAT